MNIHRSTHRIRALITGILITVFLMVTHTSAVAASKETLWNIINNCLDITALDYCTTCNVQRTESGCGGGAANSCATQLDVWAESSNYVAIRDQKMCGCPSDFVHGLAIPRAHVTGVEDPKRPTGIWAFAWAEARSKISDEKTIALVVNPALKRSQDQLHVHIVRLKKDARHNATAQHQARVESLDLVWSVARQLAKDPKFDDYGVLVIKHPETGYLVLISRESPEYKYTEATCGK